MKWISRKLLKLKFHNTLLSWVSQIETIGLVKVHQTVSLFSFGSLWLGYIRNLLSWLTLDLVICFNTSILSLNLMTDEILRCLEKHQLYFNTLIFSPSTQRFPYYHHWWDCYSYKCFDLNVLALFQIMNILDITRVERK